MKKKYIILNIITGILPIVFGWLIPMYIVGYFDKISRMTYIAYPRLIAELGSGLLLGLSLSYLWVQYTSKPSMFTWGFLAAVLVALVQEINLYTVLFIHNNSLGNSALIHLFLGIYSYLFVYSIYKRKHMNHNKDII